MSQVPFPSPEPDGDEPPLPGDAARDGTARGSGDDDFDAAADLARFIEEVDSGQIPIPPEEDLRAPAVMFTLGEAADVDPVELAAMAGPDGLGGQGFAQDHAADGLRPGPLLAALTENAARDVRLLSDDELLGMISAARRLANRAEYLQLAAIAEFSSRRRAQYAASVAHKDRPGRRAGEFADAELGMELGISGRAAGERMELATGLATRLPRTFGGLADGTIDAGKTSVIWFYTRFLSDADAAEADTILAAAAPGIRLDSLARKAAALEIKLDPAAARARKEQARTQGRRVEARREASGNMSYGGRELGVEEALAVSAAVEADAVALRRAGMAGALGELRVLAFIDRLRGRDPLDRLTDTGDRAEDPGNGDRAEDAGDGPLNAPGDGPADAPDDAGPRDDDAGPCDGERPARRGGHGRESRDPAPLPALTNLLIPASTLLGWGTAPGEAGRWGLLDPDDTRGIVRAASRHSRTRWCVTVVGPDGTAVGHGCSRGPHQWTPAPPGTCGHGTRPPPGPDEQQRAQLAQLLRALNVTVTPIAKDACDHRDRESRYEPSRKLKHLIRARTATCPATGCGGQAWHADIDHTIVWPDGPTCQENLSPPCRHHHRVKQAPGWKLEQPEPGVMRWTTPSGRTYSTAPTVYDP